MEILNFIILMVGALVIYTKLLDCRSTVKFVKSHSLESNKIAKSFMIRYGFKNTIWGIFFFTFILVVFSVWCALEAKEFLSKLLFIIIGFIVSIFQFNVAKFNRTKKMNWVTKMVSRWKWH